MGSLRDVLAVQLDPYYLAPLWPDAISLAALQARAVLEGTAHTEREMAEAAARSRRDAANNPHAVVSGDADVDTMLREPFVVSPLRHHDRWDTRRSDCSHSTNAASLNSPFGRPASLGNRLCRCCAPNPRHTAATSRDTPCSAAQTT